MAPQGDGGDFTEMAGGKTRNFPATILICWFIAAIAAIVVVLSLTLSGAVGRTAGVANSSGHADRLAWIPGRGESRRWRV